MHSFSVCNFHNAVYYPGGFIKYTKIFFADADRAMPFTEFQKLNEKFEYLHDSWPDLIVIGSRAHLEKNSIAQRRDVCFCYRSKIEHHFLSR